MSNLWRTQRIRFPFYVSDGFGRDYYIKYTNGGYWENQFFLTKKADYERPHYKNFHTLYHLAAPVKYYGDGKGRENYILKCNGFHHDQKPLCSYQLIDFLRNDENSKSIHNRKKVYFSVTEARYNKKLKDLEKKLVKRLYTEPMKKRKKTQILAESNSELTNKDSINFGKCFTPLTRSRNENKKNSEFFSSARQLNTDFTYENNKNTNKLKLDTNNIENKYKNILKFTLSEKNSPIKKKFYNKTFYGQFNSSKPKKLSNNLNHISPNNNLRFINTKIKNSKNSEFEEPAINKKILFKKIKII